MKILHISAHLGGGAGKAITGLINSIIDNEIIHEIVVLEKAEKTIYFDELIANNVKVFYLDEIKDFNTYLGEFDLIILNWWNHPKMVDLFMKFPKTPIRIIIWSHVNGCTYPFLPFSYIKYVNKFIFTCYYSYDNHLWNEIESNMINKETEVVFGFGDFNPKKIQYKKCYKTINNNIRIGYVGTLNYSKLNKHFVKYCEKIVESVNNVEFILYGDIDSELMSDIRGSVYNNKFICKGYCNNIEKELLGLDIFGYPLNLENYATTENSILEAMAAGLPIVAINQNTEKYIIENNNSGFLVRDMEDYAIKILLLCNNIDLREKMGKSARKKVIEKFNFEENLKNYINICKSVFNEPKREICFNKIIGHTIIEYFLYFAGPYRKEFEEILITKKLRLFDRIPDIFLGDTKGSVTHFVNTFSTDADLNKLKTLLDEYLKIKKENL